MRRRHITRTLLVQIRESPTIADEEYFAFLRYGRLEPEQLERVNLFDSPELSECTAGDYQAVFVGGASDASVLEPVKYPFVLRAQAFMNECLEANVPVFASCFGFQLAVQALGGSIVHQSEGFEMGTIPITLTPAAATDPLFKDTPDGFYAVSVHREKATELPPTCELLAYTEACCHAFKVKGKPFWGFQFHPEVDRDILVSRLTFYKDHYTGDDSHLQNVLDHAVEVPESTALMTRFVDWLDYRLKAVKNPIP